MPIAVAGRYARALADVVARTGDYSAALKELGDFVVVYRKSAEMREAMEAPTLPVPVRLKVLEAVASRLAISPTLLNFLRVLAANYRMSMLEEVSLAFRKAANARQGIVEVKISSAAPLSDAEKRALRARFGELTRRRVELDFQLDPKLLGGILAQIGSTLYDGSVLGHLRELGRRLASS